MVWRWRPLPREPLLSFSFQKALRFDCGHATRACRGNGLPVASVLLVAGVKHTLYVGACAAMRDDIAVCIELELAGERPRVRDMTDCHKKAVHLAIVHFVRS